jgi:hypothetical protein
VLSQSATPRELCRRNYETVKSIRLAISEPLGADPNTVTLQVMDDVRA